MVGGQTTCRVRLMLPEIPFSLPTFPTDRTNTYKTSYERSLQLLEKRIKMLYRRS